MKWVRDRTGRFFQRPHYSPEELDFECEKLLSDFFEERQKSPRYPISTDDLTILLETLTEDLDLYASFLDDDEVEGVTEFLPGRRPTVRISNLLSVNPLMENRLRTTLTHELGHVRFHTFMFDSLVSESLFESPSTISNKCNRASMMQVARTDWMEWQAGFACGAFLMPATPLRAEIQRFLIKRNIVPGSVALGTLVSADLIAFTSRHFAVSRDAARVRLLQRGLLSEVPTPPRLL